MGTWKFRWAVSEMTSLLQMHKHRQILRSPWKFYFSLLVKLIPGIWPFNIHLVLKGGGVIIVNKFMTLFIYREIFVDGCYDIDVPSIDPPIIIDIGSNTGLFIIRMKQLYSDAYIWGYEPLPANFEQLYDTIELSNLKNVNVLMKGVGGTTRKEKLFIHLGNIGGNSIFQEATGSDKYEEIDLLDLNEVIRPLAGKTCNLMKIDCEGAEYEIIKSIDRGLAKRVERILFEGSPFLYNIEELIDHLKNLDYNISMHKGLYYAIQKKEPPTSDGID